MVSRVLFDVRTCPPSHPPTTPVPRIQRQGKVKASHVSDDTMKEYQMANSILDFTIQDKLTFTSKACA